MNLLWTKSVIVIISWNWTTDFVHCSVNLVIDFFITYFTQRNWWPQIVYFLGDLILEWFWSLCFYAELQEEFDDTSKNVLVYLESDYPKKHLLKECLEKVVQLIPKIRGKYSCIGNHQRMYCTNSMNAATFSPVLVMYCKREHQVSIKTWILVTP